MGLPDDFFLFIFQIPYALPYDLCCVSYTCDPVVYSACIHPRQANRVSVALVAKPVLILLHFEMRNPPNKCLQGFPATEQLKHLIKPVV